MTSASRQVLNDCREALSELAEGIQGSTWRRRWSSAVVLLRTVGHVLEKVDAACDPKLKSEVTRWWKQMQATKPRPEIFWMFIYEERNSIVKEYRTNAGQGVTVPGVMIEANPHTGEQRVTRLGDIQYHYVMNDGHFIGQDQRHLVAEAIDWWSSQLDAIDQTVLKNVP